MELTRTPLLWDGSTDDPAVLCAQLSPGRWLVEPGHDPLPEHFPAALLDDRAPDGSAPPDVTLGSGMAISLSSIVAIRLSLGPALADQLAQHGVYVGPLAALALHELVGNAVIHGNLAVASGRSLIWQDLAERQEAIAAALADPRLAGRLVTVAIGWRGERVVAVVADEGAGYEATRPDAPGCDPKRGSGRGLRIARAVGDVEVRCGGRHTRLTLECVMPAPVG